MLQRHVFEQFAFVGRDVWWTVPLVNLALFGAAGVAFTVAAPAVRGMAVWTLGVWSCAFAGGLGALLTFVLVHRGAMLLLAAGIATQVTRMAVAHRAGFNRLVRSTTPWLLMVAVAAAATVRGTIWWQEHRALARTPVAAAGSPNVLLIVLDTVRAASTSLYGYSRPTTPHLEQWAAEGALFTEAFATSPWTLPSHASMLTGRWEPELSTDWMRPLDGREPTLAEVLAARGYATAGFVANTDYASAEVGLARGFAHFEDYVLTPGLIVRSSALGRGIERNSVIRRLFGNEGGISRRNAPDISAAFLAWTARHADRPWFAMLNYYDAHRPYLPPEPFYSRFASAAVSPDPRFSRDEDPRQPWTASDAARFQAAYDGAIAYLDSEIHRLFLALRQRGDLDRTTIVVTSDHGEEFGEHRLWDHGHSLYLPALHVPLIVRAPGRVPARTIVETPVSIRDIPATVLDLIGGGSASPFPGRSLSRFWEPGRHAAADDVVIAGVRRTPGHPAWYPVSRGDLIGVVQRQFHYIRNLGDDTEELFDFRADPWERRDLATDHASRPVLERLRGEAEQVPRPSGSASALNARR